MINCCVQKKIGCATIMDTYINFNLEMWEDKAGQKKTVIKRTN